MGQHIRQLLAAWFLVLACLLRARLCVMAVMYDLDDVHAQVDNVSSEGGWVVHGAGTLVTLLHHQGIKHLAVLSSQTFQLVQLVAVTLLRIILLPSAISSLCAVSSNLEIKVVILLVFLVRKIC